MIKRLAIADDDPIFQFTTKVKLEKLKLVEEIRMYNDGEEIHQFLQQCAEEELPEVLLLDINMPIVDGWDFLELFDQLPDSKKSKVRIYMLSSSINPVDVEKAEANPLISRYITKPIADSILQELLG